MAALQIKYGSVEPLVNSLRQDLSLFAEYQVPHAVSKTNASIFELRHWPVIRSRRVAVCSVFKAWLTAEDHEHLLGIVLPVGRAVQIATRYKAGRQQVDQRRLNKAPLVVTGLVPRVGKENVHASERCRRNHVAQHLNGVVLDQPEVVQLLFVDLLQQATYARRVYLDSQEIRAGHSGGDRGCGFAHAEADFKDGWRFPSERAGIVYVALGIRYAELRTQRLQSAGLRGGEAAGSRYKTADAVLGGIVEQGLAGAAGRGIGHAGGG